MTFPKSTGAMVLSLLFTGCGLDPEAELGGQIFNDTNLSANQNQACASCHSRDTAGTGPDSRLNALGAVYEGSIAGRFGNRKPPSTVYASLAPRFDYEAETGFVGGNFWDGRATGWKLGTPVADQAQGPFLNPVEQALSSSGELVERVCQSSYGDSFRTVWGHDACEDTDKGFAAIARSIASFESSPVVNQFSSKYDAVQRGSAQFTGQEAQGYALFQGRAQCSQCHSLDGDPAPFTDGLYDNLGIPRNPQNPFYAMDSVLVDGEPINPAGSAWVDPGLGGFLARLAADDGWRSLPYVTDGVLALSSSELTVLAEENLGKHRVPTLRNVDVRPNHRFVKAYGHNGYFKSLEGIVHFYNSRDVLPRCEGDRTEAQALAEGCWPAPEEEANINVAEMGNLGLTFGEEGAIVAFLRTLSDGWGERD